MKGQFEKVLLIALAVILISVGCNPSPVKSTISPEPTATTAPTFPTGTFIKGGWTWEIKPDGSYYTKSKFADDNGFYTVTGNQVAIQGDINPCKDIIGTYTWTFDGNKLILTAVDDQCTDRREAADGTWRLKP